MTRAQPDPVDAYSRDDGPATLRDAAVKQDAAAQTHADLDHADLDLGLFLSYCASCGRQAFRFFQLTPAGELMACCLDCHVEVRVVLRHLDNWTTAFCQHCQVATHQVFTLGHTVCLGCGRRL